MAWVYTALFKTLKVFYIETIIPSHTDGDKLHVQSQLPWGQTDGSAAANLHQAAPPTTT